MAISVDTTDVLLRTIEGVDEIVYGALLMSGTYVTNGFSVTASTFGLKSLKVANLGAYFSNIIGSSVAYYDYNNHAIKIFGADGAELPNATNVGFISLPFRAVGS